MRASEKTDPLGNAEGWFTAYPTRETVRCGLLMRRMSKCSIAGRRNDPVESWHTDRPSAAIDTPKSGTPECLAAAG
jgi:hypothetical protein